MLRVWESRSLYDERLRSNPNLSIARKFPTLDEKTTPNSLSVILVDRQSSSLEIKTPTTITTMKVAKRSWIDTIAQKTISKPLHENLLAHPRYLQPSHRCNPHHSRPFTNP
jgi:hypothetical protein